MEIARLAQLQSFFTADKVWIQDGYYRIRRLENGDQELAYLVLDPCGGTIVHPQIRIRQEDQHWIAIQLTDLEATPILRITRQAETKAQLDEALEQLVLKFEHAIAKLNEDEMV